MNGQRVLVAEDDEKTARLLQKNLEEHGFKSEWLTNGLEVLHSIEQCPPDLLLLDMMMPGMDGMEVLKQVRAISNLPIIMLTARVEESDRLLGLELGADDFICKPFSPREVMARVKIVLRRSAPALRPPPLEAGSLQSIRLDQLRHEVYVAGELLALTPNEYNLLETFVNNPGRVFSRDYLLERICTNFRPVSDRSIDSHIKNLRKKLSKALPGHGLIISVYGVGYKYQPRPAP